MDMSEGEDQTLPYSVEDILSDAPIFDGHNDLPWALRGQYGYDLEAAQLHRVNTNLHTDLPSLRAGGVGAQFWSVYVPSDMAPHAAVSATLEQIDCVYQMVDSFSAELQLATTADEAEKALAAGKIASMLGMEGGHSIDASLGTLRMMRRLGVSYMTLTHNHNTAWAASATGEPVDYGLTAFGREVVAEMNRIGMLVDLSHVHERTMQDALDVTEVPVIFSHSSCRAVHDHPRNVPDNIMGQLGHNGGVQMITFVPRFVSADPANADIDDVVAHIEHAREVAGIDHVGLGGDFDGVPQGPKGLRRVSDYPSLLRALADRQWSATELRKLTSGNILRVVHDAGV